ncbi:MAG TPA: MMPL family transporter [Candidatus Binataceae bacterium]|nr:MMPL family transporter [Candidatus Binataceae bacterium]
MELLSIPKIEPSSTASRARKYGDLLLRYRQPLALAFLAITLFMGYWALHVRFATRFEDLLPARHPNVKLYREFEDSYGRAQTLVVMLRVKQGDLFNPATLRKVQDLTFAINRLAGVNHNEVFSLASYRVVYAHTVPGALVLRTFMYPTVPKTQAAADELRRTVMAHRPQLAGLITDDDKGALIVAGFNEYAIDYKESFKKVARLRAQYEDANTRLYASGDVMVFGWGYHFLPRIKLIFALSIALTLAIVYMSLGSYTGWWVPIVTGICSAIWGLGFMGLAGFNFDPVMLVIPLILTARDLSHGIQWQGRYYDELDRTPETMAALAQTTGAMLPAGLLAILANIAGIIFVTLSDIPVLRHIGLGGAVWLGSSLALVFVMQPIVMSWLPRPQPRRERRLIRRAAGRYLSLNSINDWLIRIPIRPGAARGVLVAASAILLVAGIISARGIRIGYRSSSIPIFRPNATINGDYAAINRFVPTNTGWIMLATPNFPSRQSSIGPDVLRMERDLGDYLLARGDIAAIMGFDSMAARPMNSLLHYGSPKFLSTSNDVALSGTIWMMFFSSATSDEIRGFFAHSPAMTSSCIRVLLRDQTYAHLERLRTDLDAFVRARVATDPSLDQVKLLYLGGDAGVVLATDEVLGHLNITNLVLTLAVILVCCAIMFRSLMAGLLFVITCVAANIVAFIYMQYRGIGLTIDIIPILSLGIGLGINFGIYTVYRIRDEVRNGAALDQAIALGISTTGIWVLASYVVMVGGILPWAFSPLLFHNQMSILLILLMSANLIAGVLLLPALIAWIQPRFLLRDERRNSEAEAASVRAVS